MKNCIHYLFFCLLFSAVMLSCSKSESLTLDAFNADPIFMFQAIVGGEREELFAGFDDYYMFTSFEQDTNGVFIFSGTLDKVSCEEACPRNTFLLDIRDSQTTNVSMAVQSGGPIAGNHMFYRHHETGQDLENLQFSTATIKWIDKTFATYSSEYLDQGESSYFEIVDVEPFDINEQGFQSVKLNIRFSCDLLGDNGMFLNIRDGVGTIAVAVPQ